MDGKLGTILDYNRCLAACCLDDQPDLAEYVASASLRENASQWSSSRLSTCSYRLKSRSRIPLRYEDCVQGRSQDFRSGDSPSPSLHTPPLPTPSPPLPSPSSPFPSPFPGAPPPLPARGLGEHCKLLQRGQGRSSGRKRIFGHFCSSETYLVAAISPFCACLCVSS